MSYIIGIDIGGTKINSVLMNKKGRVIDRIKFKTGKNKKDILRQIIKSIKEIKRGKNIDGIGIGVPGILNKKKDKILSLPNLSGWENTCLKK